MELLLVTIFGSVISGLILYMLETIFFPLIPKKWRILIGVIIIASLLCMILMFKTELFLTILIIWGIIIVMGTISVIIWQHFEQEKRISALENQLETKEFELKTQESELKTKESKLENKTISLGWEYFNSKKYIKAEKEFKAAINIKNPTFLAKSHFGLGATLLYQGKNQEALKNFNKTTEYNKDHYEAWNGMGICQKNLGNYGEALKCFKKAVGEDEAKHPNALSNMADVLTLENKLDEAIECYNKVLEINPQNYKTWCDIGDVYRKKGDTHKPEEHKKATLQYKEAIKCCKNAIEVEPENKQNSTVYKNVIEWCKKIIAENPKDLEALREEGNAYRELGEYKNAIKSYNALNEVLEDSEKLPIYSKIIECCKKIIAENSKDLEAWQEEGDAYKGLGEYKNAIDCYEKAVGADKINSEVYRGIIYCGGELEKKKPEDLKNLERIGDAYKGLEKYEEAIEYYRKVGVKNKPEILGKMVGCSKRMKSGPISKILDIVGTEAESVGKESLALSCYGEAINVDSKNYEACRKKGNLHKKLGGWKEAVECYKKIEDESKSSEDWRNMGDCYKELGKKCKKIEIFKEAIKCYEKVPKDDRDELLLDSMGNCYMELSEWKDAIGTFEKIPDKNTEIRKKMTKCFENLDPVKAGINNALIAFEEKLKTEKDIINNTGMMENIDLYRKAGEHNKEIEIWKEILETVGKKVGKKRLGNIKVKIMHKLISLRDDCKDIEKYSEAIEVSKMILTIDPDNEPVKEEVISIYEEKKKREPENPGIPQELGDFFKDYYKDKKEKSYGDYKDAIEKAIFQYQEAINLSLPVKNEKLHYSKGECRMEIAEYDKALKCFEKIKEEMGRWRKEIEI